MKRLGGMACYFEAETYRWPTMKELADCWQELSDWVHNTEEETSVYRKERIWLRELEKRPDADALLAKAIRLQLQDEQNPFAELFKRRTG
jgi:hypothetical protein